MRILRANPMNTTSRALGSWARLSVLGTLIVVLSTPACDDPTRVRTPPPLSNQLEIMAVLDPDRTIQHVQVEPLDTSFNFTGITGRLYENGELVETDFLASPAQESDARRTRCQYTFGSAFQLEAGVCLEFDYWPDYDAEYRVEVSASGYRTASGRTQVPGRFDIRQHSASGSPPGTGGLTLRWTESQRVHTYVVSVVPDSTSCCGAWHTETDQTRISTTAPVEPFSGNGPWKIRLRAISQSLYEYLTTGADGSLFSVPPIQNVEDGYGVVGGWTSRDIVRDTVQQVVRRGEWQVAGRPLPEIIGRPRAVAGSRSGTVYVMHLARGTNNGALVRWNPQSNSWTTPYSGYVLPTTLASLENGVVVTTAMDNRWTPILIPDDGGDARVLTQLPERGNPFSAFVDEAEGLQIFSQPIDPNRTPYVLRSTDWGDTFQRVEIEANAPQVFAFSDIEESPVDGTLYAVCSLCEGEAPMHRSTDRGASWELVGASLVDQGRFRHVEVGAGGRVFIAGSGGVLYSDDRGESWTRASSEPVRHLRVNRRNPDQVWFTSNRGDDGSFVFTAGVFQSTDGGRTFQSIGLENSNPRGLVVDPGAQKLYFVDDQKMLLALDIP